MLPMAPAEHVARFILLLACEEAEPERVTHLRLQKLLYYVQGWSLALLNQPAFDERIEGWISGPVVKDVYPKFADFGETSIPASEASDSLLLSERNRQLIKAVWESYKQYSATGLRDKTHAERPWLKSRTGLAWDERGDRPIPQSELRSFFRAEYDRKAVPGLELDRLERGEREIREGKGIRLADVKERLSGSI